MPYSTDFGLASLFDLSSHMSGKSTSSNTGKTAGMTDTPEKASASDAAANRRRNAAKRGAYAIVVEDPSDVVRASEISSSEADEVWMEALKIWGVVGGTSTSSDKRRDEFKQMFALAILEATSGDDENLSTTFFVDDVEYSLVAIRDAMNGIAKPKPNPLRVFVNSYDNAHFALVCMDTLDDPANVELRQAMALRTGGPVEHAPYMFDCAGAAIRKSGRVFSNFEINMVRYYRGVRAKMIDIGGDVGGAGANDNTTRMRREYNAPPPGSGNAQPVSRERIRFPAV